MIVFFFFSFFFNFICEYFKTHIYKYVMSSCLPIHQPAPLVVRSIFLRPPKEETEKASLVHKFWFPIFGMFTMQQNIQQIGQYFKSCQKPLDKNHNLNHFFCIFLRSNMIHFRTF